MGETDPRDALIVQPDRAERARAFGALAKMSAAKAHTQGLELAEQATALEAAIEASQRQITESLAALQEEGEDVMERVREVGDRAKHQLDVRRWVREHPRKTALACFALGFYLAMD